MSVPHVLRLNLFLCLSVCLGCDSGEDRAQQAQLDPQSIAQEALKQYDADNDGAITGPELVKVPGLKAGITLIDKNNDGRITADEVAARIQAYIDDRSAMMMTPARATLNGQALAAAVVTLVPETFMGSAVKVAKATTDAKGFCVPSIEGESFPGANCGIYRVQVSKLDASGKETLPSRYNAASILGADVGVQSPSLYDGLGLSLTSP